MREGKVGTNKTTIVNPAEELVFEVTPNSASLSLSYERQPREIEDERVGRFAKSAATALGIVIDELEIEAFQRIGYRELYYFPGTSVEDTEEWIRGLGVVSVSEAVYAKFGREFYALSYAILVAGEECRYRIEVKGAERSAEVPVGQADIAIKASQAKRRDKAELLRLLKEARHRQIDPLYTAVLDIEAYLWDDTETDFDLEGFISDHAESNLTLFRSCVDSVG